MTAMERPVRSITKDAMGRDTVAFASPATLLMTFGVAVTVGCSPERQHLALSGPLHIASGASVTISSPEPMLTPNLWNALCLLPGPPNGLQQPSGGILSAGGGSEFVPRVSLRGAAGSEDVSAAHIHMGSVDGEWLCFEARAPLHAPYTAISISSPGELQLSAIKWHSSDK